MPQNTARMILSNKLVIFIYSYYSLTLMVGLIASIYAICYPPSASIFINSVIGGLGMSLSGSSIFYIRKIYKSTLNDTINFSISSEHRMKRLATTIYLIARPFFSMAFSILLIVGIRVGFIVSSPSKIDLNEGFIFMVMFLSFFVGFLSGKFLKYLETEGAKYVLKGLSEEVPK